MVGLIIYYRKNKVEEVYLEREQASFFPSFTTDIAYSIFVQTNGETCLIKMFHEGVNDELIIGDHDIIDEFVQQSLELYPYNLYLVNLN